MPQPIPIDHRSIDIEDGVLLVRDLTAHDSDVVQFVAEAVRTNAKP
jgi:hypothetical protein